jgi:type 1 glutamine amidotransferase
MNQTLTAQVYSQMNFTPDSRVCREQPSFTLNMKLFTIPRLITLFTLLGGLAVHAAEQKKILVVTVTKGFRHSSIPTAMKVIADLGEKSKVYTVDFAFTDADLAAKMTPDKLKAYDAFIFANTTLNLPLPDKQAFLDAIKGGKGFIGMHSASDTFHSEGNTVDPYIEMLGGEFQGHGSQVGVECLVQDKTHPSTKHFGESFCIEREEVYLLTNYDPAKVHDLLSLDKHPNKKSEAGHFPIAWCKLYGQGKVFYTSLGHREDVWENKAYQDHILGGIKWALGIEPGDATPKGK